MCCCMPCEMRGCGTVCRTVSWKDRASEQTNKQTNKTKNMRNKTCTVRRSAGESERMPSAGRRDEQKEQERPHRPGDGGDEQCHQRVKAALTR